MAAPQASVGLLLAPSPAFDAVRPFAPIHWQPIIKALDTGAFAFVVVIQGHYPFDIALADRPVLALIGDDTDRAVGPAGFDSASLSRLFRHARHAVIVAGRASVELYGHATATAVMGGFTVLIETRPEKESDWLDLVRREARDASVLVSTVWPAGDLH